MNKSALSIEHLENINFAVGKGLGIQDWELISLLNGGLTGIPVFKIKVNDKLYAIKLENSKDRNFDLVRNYEIVAAVSKQGISPKIYFIDVQRGIILMRYIESKPRPATSPLWMKKFTAVIRKLHDNNSFSTWKSVAEILHHYYQDLPSQYMQKSIIKKCIQEIYKMETIIFDQNDLKFCHCDLNPGNILFDGKKYFFVDWQAASPQSFYFDLAYTANWLYFYSEDLCIAFLSYYLGREPSAIEKAKYYLMRVFAHIYLGIGFISLPLKIKPDFHVLTDSDINKLPNHLAFMQAVGSGVINLADATNQQQLGFIFLKTAEGMMNDQYQHAYEIIYSRTEGSLTDIKV